MLKVLRRALLCLPLLAGVAHAQSLGGIGTSYSSSYFRLVDAPLSGVPGIATSTINVSNVGADRVIAPNAIGQSVVVRLEDFDHSYSGDLAASLRFTSSQPENFGAFIEWSLFARPGKTSTSSFGAATDFDGSYSFGEFNPSATFFTGDLHAQALMRPAAYFSGDYFGSSGLSEPNSPGALFGGLNPNGAWQLRISDFEPQDTGDMLRWTLAINTVGSSTPLVVPEPASVALLAFGLLALATSAHRRRPTVVSSRI